MYMHTRAGDVKPFKFSFPPRGHPMRWGFDLKQVLAEEFLQLAEREKLSPYHRGETSIRPGPDDDNNNGSDSGESEVDIDTPMTSDAPVPDEDLGSDDSMSESEEEVSVFLGRTPHSTDLR
jgi:hypothetical protein